jgi:glycosyltransferase involved in cell wall biosynthesis
VNLPAERDRRVIRECQALEAAGYRVTVICPRGSQGLKRLPGTRSTTLRTFRQPFAGSGAVSFAIEFAWSFTCVAWHLGVLVSTRRVVAAQVCNPPDVFWPLALLMRVTGHRWIFDHHDLSGELYECKPGGTNPVLLRVLLWFEKMSMRCANMVVSTNGSYRDIAINRGGVAPDRVVVVRNGPTIAEVGASGAEAVTPDVDGVHEGRIKRIAYVGVINPQDRVDIAVDAAKLLVGLRGTEGWEMVIAGDGECLADLRTQVAELGLQDVVRFAGWLEAAGVDRLLRSSTIGIQPDPPTAMADLSTMAKTVEYLARGLPVVAADLKETRFSAGDAGVYVATGAAQEYAIELHRLLDEPETLATMSKVALERFHTVLAWEHQAAEYIRVWRALVPTAV